MLGALWAVQKEIHTEPRLKGEGGDLVTTITNRNTRCVLGADITVTVDRDRPQFATNPALTTFSFGATTSLLPLPLGSFPGSLSLSFFWLEFAENSLWCPHRHWQRSWCSLLREVNSVSMKRSRSLRYRTILSSVPSIVNDCYCLTVSLAGSRWGLLTLQEQ